MTDPVQLLVASAGVLTALSVLVASIGSLLVALRQRATITAIHQNTNGVVQALRLTNATLLDNQATAAEIAARLRPPTTPPSAG